VQVKKLRKHFRPSVESGPRPGAPLPDIRKAIAFVAVLGSVTTLGAMFWALHDLPAERSIASNGEASFLIEAANDETLGRVGPLKMADAAPTDFPAIL